MPVVLAADGLGDGRIHRMHQVEGGLEGLLRPMLADNGCDAGGPLFLAVFLDDAGNFLLTPGVEEVGGGHALGAIHAHVQGRVLMVGEAALAHIQLGG